MAYQRETPDTEVILSIMRQSGITMRQLSKLIYGETTHRNFIKEIKAKPDIRSSTLVKLCNVLGVSMDSLYVSGGNPERIECFPSVEGKLRVAGKNKDNDEVASLGAEIKALQMLIEEKNKRIEDLKTVNSNLWERLDFFISKSGTQSGQ